MLNDIAFICYSHSTYSDIWDMFFGQVNKYLPDTKKYLFVDSVNRDITDDIEVILYNDSDSYTDRVVSCLKQVDEELCFYNHEDFVLYDKPDVGKLNELIKFLSEYNIDYIKLLRGDCHNGNDNLILEDMPISNLYWIPHTGMSFTIQPTLCKVSTLLDIFSSCPNKKVNEIEQVGSDYVNQSDINGVFHYNGEDKRGRAHWDSSIYPQGGMVSEGKWNVSEYKSELEKLSLEYNVTLSDRGVK